MSSHPYVMDDSRLSEASGGPDHLRYPWMRHIPPPPAEGRVTPPKPTMKPWAGQDAASTTATSTTTSATPASGRHDDVIVIPRPFAFNNHDVRKEELLNPFKDPNDSKPEASHDAAAAAANSSSNTAFDKGFVRELEKIDGVTVKCGPGGPGGGSGGGVVACLGGGLKPRINCEFCEQTFSRREGLKRHEITAHTDIRNFKCVECPQTFARKDKLKRHVETVHMTEKRFECETCGKGFNRKDKLQKHLHSDKAHVMAALKPNTMNKATQEPPLTPETENNLRKDFETQKKLEEEERMFKKQQQTQTDGNTVITPSHPQSTSQTTATTTTNSTTTPTPHHQPHHHSHHHHQHHHQHLPHQMNEYSDSARAFLETLSQRLNTDLPVFP